MAAHPTRTLSKAAEANKKSENNTLAQVKQYTSHIT
jgi:hypothetical protein